MTWISFLEVFIIVFTVGLYLFMKKKGHKNVLKKMIILFIGVLLFEMMSEPMWLNIGFDRWAYIYNDITWIITLGWVNIFMVSMLVVDRAFYKLPERRRFWLYLLFSEAITVPIEMLLLMTGIRKYAPVLMETMTGFTIPFTNVPLEAIYAIPLFTSLILAFYKYVNHIFEVKNGT